MCSKTFVNNKSLSVKEVQTGNDLVIYGETVPSGREPFLLKNNHPTACPVCATGIDIKHTDVLILSQFVRSDGCMLPRRITGLCKSQQKRMSSLVTMAHKAGKFYPLIVCYIFQLLYIVPIMCIIIFQV